jgi:hypothetical protein
LELGVSFSLPLENGKHYISNSSGSWDGVLLEIVRFKAGDIAMFSVNR